MKTRAARIRRNATSRNLQNILRNLFSVRRLNVKIWNHARYANTIPELAITYAEFYKFSLCLPAFDLRLWPSVV
jgi:hypothetical protein